MPDKLPRGWVKTTLGELCAINPRPTFEELPSEETEVSFVPMAAVEEETGRLDASDFRPLSVVRKGYTPFRENDVIFAKITPCMENGKIALATGLKNGLAYGSTEFFVFRPYEGLLPRFVLYFLLQPSFRHEAERRMSGAVGQKRVSRHYLSTHRFLLPPTREQQRIVERLDGSLSRLAAGEAAAGRALDRIKRYRAAVLQAAITGELTREWRKTHKPGETGEQLLDRSLKARRARWEEAERKRLRATRKAPKDDNWKLRYTEPTPPSTADLPLLPNGWTWASLDQLSFVVRGASPRPAGDPRYFGGPITKDSKPYLTDVGKSVTEAGKEASRFIEKDTLLLTNSGATLGVPKISRISGCINDGVAALLHVDYPLKLYLYYFLSSQTDQLRSINRGAAQPNLNTGIIRAIVAPIPPSEELSRIIREMERRVAAADRLTASLNRQLARARTTRQSVFRDAFTGHLVPQDPTDEPGSVLLDRIRAAREAEAKKPRGERMPKSKSKLTRRPLLDVLREHKKPMTPEQLFRTAGFQPAQADLFYRELASLRKILREKKPSASEAKTWPYRSHVQLELKER
jgi:type I restriction enzyme S subunit